MLGVSSAMEPSLSKVVKYLCGPKFGKYYKIICFIKFLRCLGNERARRDGDASQSLQILSDRGHIYGK